MPWLLNFDDIVEESGFQKIEGTVGVALQFSQILMCAQ